MTKEEAIQIVEAVYESQILDTFGLYVENEVAIKIDTAFKMVIKAVEQQKAIEECTCCEYRVGGECCYADVEQTEDVISRQAVINAIEELKKIHFDRVVVLNKVRDRVLGLPPVNPTSNISIQITEREKYGRFN